MNTETKVIEMIADFFDLETSEIKLESNLKEDIGADSLDFMELVGDFEDEFDFEADEDQLMNLKTVKDVVDYINSEVK